MKYDYESPSLELLGDDQMKSIEGGVAAVPLFVLAVASYIGALYTAVAAVNLFVYFGAWICD